MHLCLRSLIDQPVDKSPLVAFIGKFVAEHFFRHLDAQEGHFPTDVAEGALLFGRNLDLHNNTF